MCAFNSPFCSQCSHQNSLSVVLHVRKTFSFWEFYLSFSGLLYLSVKICIKGLINRYVGNWVFILFNLLNFESVIWKRTSQVALVVKNPPPDAGDIRDMGTIPGLGRSRGGGHGNPLQYSCLQSFMDREARQATVDRVSRS